MQCNKLNGKFLKVEAKVSGFLIAKIEKRTAPEKTIVVTVKRKKNTILTSGLQNLLNAFQTYMSGVNYVGENASLPGIIITTSSGQQITLPFVNTPGVSATSNSAIISFTARDDSPISYTATSEELVTTSAGYNIPIATANLPITKNSDEILTMTWVITISISTSGNIIYVPTPTPQVGNLAPTSSSSGCSLCAISSVNSVYTATWGGCSLTGILSQYAQSSFVTTQLFTDIFYNTYSKGSSNPFTYASGTTLFLYTPYCTQYFFAGIVERVGDFYAYNPSKGEACYVIGIVLYPLYFQGYFPSETASYVGVQIEFTT